MALVPNASTAFIPGWNILSYRNNSHYSALGVIAWRIAQRDCCLELYDRNLVNFYILGADRFSVSKFSTRVLFGGRFHPSCSHSAAKNPFAWYFRFFGLGRWTDINRYEGCPDFRSLAGRKKRIVAAKPGSFAFVHCLGASGRLLVFRTISATSCEFDSGMAVIRLRGSGLAPRPIVRGPTRRCSISTLPGSRWR